MDRAVTQESDRLLYVVSTKGEMAWERFKETFETLYLMLAHENALVSADIDIRRQTVRALSSLAHCDFDYSGERSRVYAAPAMLARLPQAGLPKAVLVGSRVPRTIEDAHAACIRAGRKVAFRVTQQDARLALVPSRVVIHAERLSDLEEIAFAIDVQFAPSPPAWEILQLSGSLDELPAASRWQPEEDFAGWRRQDFDPRDLRLVPRGATAIGIHLVGFTRLSTQKRRFYIRDGGRQAMIDLDWGRYAVLRGKRNVLVYDPLQFLLAVPIGAPLPALLARAATLCSGYAPSFLYVQESSWSTPETRGFDVYRFIPPEIACALAEKLGQSLVMEPITISV